jgi:26S proteasome regulatory subunit N1
MTTAKEVKEPVTSSSKETKVPVKDTGVDLSDEDEALKEQLESLATLLATKGPHSATLTTLSTLIKTATSSMTSVPKPLKFLRPKYEEMTVVYEKWYELS